MQALIEDGTESALGYYSRIIQNYNLGGMFKEYNNLQTDIENFKTRAKQVAEDQSIIYSEKYKNYLKSQHNERLKLCTSIIGPIIAVIAGILRIIKHWAS